MAFSISRMIESKVSVHRRNNLVIVHRILSFSESKFSELLGDDSFLELSNLPTLAFAEAGFETVAFLPAVGAAVFFAEPSEECAFAD